MFKHYLREVRDLCSYRVTGASPSPVVIGGLLVDARNWRVDRFVVTHDAPGRQSIAVPRSCFASLDDTRRTLSLDIPDDVPVVGGADARRDLQGSPRFDALRLLGQTLYGCDGGPAGSIADLLINVDLWQLRYFIIEVGSALVLTDIEWASSLARGSGQAIVDLPAIAIETAPPYQSIRDFCRGDEEALYRHYTRNEFASRKVAG